MKIRVILFQQGNQVVCANFDNDRDAQQLLNSDVETRELTSDEIRTAFGNYASLAGDKYTTVIGESVGNASVSRVVTPEMILDLRLEKLQAVQTEKVQKVNAGCIVDGVLFDSDQAAKIAYMALEQKFRVMPEHVEKDWKASLGIWVNMDVKLLAKVMRAVEQHERSCFAWQREKDKELAIAANHGLEALEAVSVSYSVQEHS